MKDVYEDNVGVYGTRTFWRSMKPMGEEIGRDQVARLMCAAGERGVSRRKRVRKACALIEVRSPDLVWRAWFRDASVLVWVNDVTHVHAHQGWMNV